MLDNYAEEIKPLFKLLSTEAFRFILVYFNHYSLLNRLKVDLRNRYSNRNIVEIDAVQSTYRQITDSYYSLENGLLLIDNFEAVLADTEKYTGLNLRRDKLATYPIAMICFISPGAQRLIAKEIMEKMPDLWSFRSLILNLERENASIAQPAIPQPQNRDTAISSLGGYDITSKIKELDRLQNSVSNNPANAALNKTIYEQIKDIQKDIGEYDNALKTIETLRKNTSDEDELIALDFEKADIFYLSGKYTNAIKGFNMVLSQLKKSERKESREIAIVNQRLGDIHRDMGDSMKALELYTNYYNIIIALIDAEPKNIDYAFHLATSYKNLGQTQASLGKLNKALAYYEQNAELSKQLYKAYPQNVSFKKGLAVSYEKLGQTQASLGNLDKALEYYEERSRIGKELYEAYPQNVEFKNGLAISYSKLGETQASLGNLDKALEYYKQCNYFEKELYEAYPKNVEFKNGLAISYSKLGETQTSLGNLDKALEYYEQDAQLSKELYEAYPKNVEFKNGLAVSYSKLALHYKGINNKEKAMLYINLCKKILQELTTDNPNYAEFTSNYNLALSVLEEIENM